MLNFTTKYTLSLKLGSVGGLKCLIWDSLRLPCFIQRETINNFHTNHNKIIEDYTNNKSKYILTFNSNHDPLADCGRHSVGRDAQVRAGVLSAYTADV